MKIQSSNPATGELLKTFEPADRRAVSAAVAAAAQAQAEWAALPFSHREKCFRALAVLIERRSDQILQLIKQETGKLIPDGEAEIPDVIDAIDYYLKGYQALQPVEVGLTKQAFPSTTATITYEPCGVIGLIMPWNFPFYVPMMLVIAALVAGNGVVLKPSEYSTMVGQLVPSLLDEAGFPKDIVRVLPGADATGRLVVESSVDRLFFVGSVAAGKDIIARAGIKPVQVELGGNSAALVLADANIDLAVEGIAWGATYHAGQDCVGIKRVLVEEAVAERFIAALTAKVQGLRPSVDYGPFITKNAMITVKERLDAAVQEGAQLLCGGQVLGINGGKGNWLSPAVVTYMNPAHELVAEETFGNVVPVMIVPSAQAAITEANATPYGLSNVIFSRDVKRAQQLAKQLESGMVFINDAMIALPGWDHWTGWKQSGFGTAESRLM